MLPQFSRLGPVSYLWTLLHNHFFDVDQEQSYSDLIFNHLLRNKVFWLIVLFSSYCDLSKIIRVSHEILGCIILAKLGPNFWFAPKGIFCENWLMLFLSTFCALSHYKVSKKILIAAHEIHGCIIFLPNWAQIVHSHQQGSFWKYLLFLLPTYYTLSYLNISKEYLNWKLVLDYTGEFYF